MARGIRCRPIPVVIPPCRRARGAAPDTAHNPKAGGAAHFWLGADRARFSLPLGSASSRPVTLVDPEAWLAGARVQRAVLRRGAQARGLAGAQACRKGPP